MDEFGWTSLTPGVPHHFGEVKASLIDPAGPSAEQLLMLDVRIVAPATCVVTVRGEIDILTAPRLESVTVTQLEAAPRVLVLDLDEVRHLASIGLSALMAVRDVAREIGTTLRLVATGAAVLRPLELTGLLPMFDVYADTRTALAGAVLNDEAGRAN